MRRRSCFADGKTPDRWDRVTTGYDRAALRELGERLGLPGGLVVEEEHSTAGAVTQWGQPFEVSQAAIEILQRITRNEQKMLRSAYEATGPMLFGEKFALTGHARGPLGTGQLAW